MEEFLHALIREYDGWVYAWIFLGAIFEGPLLTPFCGLLVAQGMLDPFLLYPIIVAGDMVGDACIYGFGRGIGWAQKKWKPGARARRRMRRLRRFFRGSARVSGAEVATFPWTRFVCGSKLGRASAIGGLAYAGYARFPYLKFAMCCTPISAVQTVGLLILGVVLGHDRKSFEIMLNVYTYGVPTLVVVYLMYKVRGFMARKIRGIWGLAS